MDTNNHSKRIRQLIAGAAWSVVVASLIGVAAMTCLLPNSQGEGKALVQPEQATPLKTAQGKPAAVAKISQPVASPRLALKENDE